MLKLLRLRSARELLVRKMGMAIFVQKEDIPTYLSVDSPHQIDHGDGGGVWLEQNRESGSQSPGETRMGRRHARLYRPRLCTVPGGTWQRQRPEDADPPGPNPMCMGAMMTCGAPTAGYIAAGGRATMRQSVCRALALEVQGSRDEER